MPQNNLFYPFITFNGAQAGARLGQQRDAWYSERHGQYYPGVYGIPALGTNVAQSGMTFSGANASSATLSAALATTYTGICLSNPAGATVNLKVRAVGWSLAPASAANMVGLITGWSSAGVVTHTTPITGILNHYVGAATSSGSVVQPAAAQAKLDAACTIVGTPLWSTTLGALASAADGGGLQELYDRFLIPPGGYIAVGGSAGSTGFWGSFTWEEVTP